MFLNEACALVSYFGVQSFDYGATSCTIICRRSAASFRSV